MDDEDGGTEDDVLRFVDVEFWYGGCCCDDDDDDVDDSDDGRTTFCDVFTPMKRDVAECDDVSRSIMCFIILKSPNFDDIRRSVSVGLILCKRINKFN